MRMTQLPRNKCSLHHLIRNIIQSRKTVKEQAKYQICGGENAAERNVVFAQILMILDER